MQMYLSKFMGKQLVKSPVSLWANGVEEFVVMRVKHWGCFRDVKDLMQLLGLSRQVSCL